MGSGVNMTETTFENAKMEESVSQKHLRVVCEIAAIFEREFDDKDEIYFIMRTLRNIFLWDSEDEHTSHLFNLALEKFCRTNREWIKINFKFEDKK